MRLIRLVPLIAVLGLAARVHAMDGVCIAAIMNGPTYKMDITFGPLVKYEIQSDLVVKVDTLNDVNAGSPKINMSGTYYAYVKMPNPSDNPTRVLVIKPLYGNPTQSVQIPLQKGAGWIWWSSDGSFFYEDSYVGTTWKGDYMLRKLSLSKVNGQLVATDRMWAKTSQAASPGFGTGAIQGGFVGIDEKGTRISFDDGLNTGGYYMSGDSTKAITNANINIVGCGNAVSPSGAWFAQFPGGHNLVAWTRWDNTVQAAGFFWTMDTTWARCGPNDPQRNLEVYAWGRWIKDPLGVFGAENIWSQNSEKWFITECAAGLLQTDADCFNAVAINFVDKYAINISRILPIKDTMSTQSWFRFNGSGGPLPGGTVQRSADRPILWCSSQGDVSDSLWHFIQNRQADNQYWSDLLGLPLSQIPQTGVRSAAAKSRTSSMVFVKTAAGGFCAVLPGDGGYQASVLDVAGREVARMNGRGREMTLPKLQAGTYLLSVRQSGRTLAGTIVVN